jgi:signal transduction histidine kinase
MTPGTSPHPRGTPSMRWAAAEHGTGGARARLAAWAAWLPNGRMAGPRLARLAAVLYLAGLAVLAMTAWHDPAAATSGLMGGLPDWHLAFLMATGTGVALLTLARPDAEAGAIGEDEAPAAPTTGLSELMAQMSHELRTPLNAVIGFSELMLRELHGPLGNARYHEYAHHISESGGRLLKSSEEALAVTEAMTALMAVRGSLRRERRAAAGLLRDAWGAATSTRERAPRLVLTTCTTCDITCEQRPTVQALQHLLGEALALSPAAAAIAVTGRRQAGRRSLEIQVERGSDPLPPAVQRKGDGAGKGSDLLAGNSLRIILARLLLEMQGATLTCTTSGETWAALVEFPGRA